MGIAGTIVRPVADKPVRTLAGKRSGMVRAAICAAMILGAPATSLGAEVLAAEPPSRGVMTEAEAVSAGCAIVAIGTGMATLAAGGVALIAAEAGVGATSTAVAVPVVIGTMAGGCSLGAMATPAFLWLKRQGSVLTSGAAALWSEPTN